MTSTTHARIEFTRDGAVAMLTIDRPPLNVLSISMLRELGAGIRAASGAGDVAAIVLRGAGERGFSSGVDLLDHRPEPARAMLRAVHDVVLDLSASPCATVAAVHGFCLGGALEIATACDLVIATPDATLGSPEIKVGCFPPVACARLADLIGPARAADLILTGHPISGARAFEMGLVSRVGPLDRTLAELTGVLAGHSRAVLAATIEALRRNRPHDLGERLRGVEEIYARRLIGSHDLVEGVEAFLEKRAPRWAHR